MAFFLSIFKKKSTVIITGINILGIGYGAYRSLRPAESPRYVVATVAKGTIAITVDGSGQVSSSNQVDVKPRASGDVFKLPIKEGQTVKAGAILAQLDAENANKTVRDAEMNLESARLSLQKLTQPADRLSVTQAENALAQAKETKQTAQDDLVKTYNDGYNSVASAFLDLPGIMTSLRNILLGTNYSPSQSNIDYYADAVRSYDSGVTLYHDNAYNDYQTARVAYDKNFNGYKTISRFSDQTKIEAVIAETYETTRNIDAAVKSITNLIQFYEDRTTEHNQKPSALADTHLTALNSYTDKADTHVASLLSAKRTIETDQQSIIAADRTITEKTQSLEKLKSGVDALDIRSAELNVRQREAALADAKSALADYAVRAPIAGVIAKLYVKLGDQASAASALATLVATQQMAQISFNEVDAAKIKIGQKAAVTFDAIDDLKITGKVAEIDTLGTVAQGVVSYNVKIIFDTQDERVKSGMSVSAAIITDTKPDTLMAPNSAIKTQDGAHYVEMFDAPLARGKNNRNAPSAVPPKRRLVQIGLTNDTDTEITSGLKEGDQIVVRTILAASAKPAPAAPSLFQTGGGSFRGVSGGSRN